MNFDPENPNWTAFALGELPEAETKDYEQEVKANPQAAAFVNDIRSFSQQLEDSLLHETIGLNSEQKEILKTAATKKPAGKRIRIPYSAWGTLTAAAAVLVLVGVGILVDPATRGYIDEDKLIQAASTPADSEIFQNQSELVEEEIMVVDEIAEKPSRAISSREVLSRPKEALEEAAQSVPAPVIASQPTTKHDRGRSDLRMELQDSDDQYRQAGQKKQESLRKAKMDRFVLGRSQAMPSSSLVAMDHIAPPPVISPSIEHYDAITEEAFKRTTDHPLSTFSIDVDTASYSNMRRFLKGGQLPPKDSIRIEELVNYFSYDYPEPDGEHPFAAHMEMHPCPWNENHQLLKIGLQGEKLAAGDRPSANLVFLLDVSGSMSSAQKLPLVKRAMKILVKQLGEADRISIVVYAGASGLVLPATSGDQDEVILEALERLSAGGGTNGGAGIDLAYKTAQENFIEGGINRVILCTDGDFNIGTVQTGDLTRVIEEKAKDGVFLTVLGFGMGNLKDSMMEQLSNKGNGNYGYIDTFSEARKMLVDQLMGTLVTIAKDVKIQVDFNPAHVAGYRLIGYENRRLNKEDFNDDKKDAGEIGAGHTVTAFYELIPAGQPVNGTPAVDESKYVTPPAPSTDTEESEWLNLRLRYKQPEGTVSTKLEIPFTPSSVDEGPSLDYQFASAVAEFGFLLRDSEHAPDASFETVIERAEAGLGHDKQGYRREFLELVRNAKALK